jgi:uncharacterized membrane protein YhhN
MIYLIFAAAPLLLAGLLYASRRESIFGELLTKPLLSVLFIVTAVIQPHAETLYYPLVLTGLILCLIGDVCLIFFSGRKVFTAGLAAFLAGHVMYVAAFVTFGVTGPLVWAATLICLGLSFYVFLWLRPHLGEMRIPVIAYIVIITAMVICAAALMNNPGLDLTARTLVFGGALLFYVSDIFVARQRFVTKAFLNRAAGLPLYYAGQFTIAFSTGLI